MPMELEQPKKLTGEIINNIKVIKQVLKKHGVPYDYTLIRSIATAFRQFRYEKEEGSIKGLPALIGLLVACEGSDIEVKGTIKKPKGKQVKGTEMKVSIPASSEILKQILYYAAIKIDSRATDEPIEPDKYTDDDFLRIAATDDDTFFPKGKNATLGKLAWGITLAFQFTGITNAKKVAFNSLIYDIMLAFGYTGKVAITEEGFSGAVGREKAQQVQNWLTAWEKWQKA